MTAPTCPGCYQAFVDDSAVADHLSDPTLPCGAWLALQDEQVPGVPLEPEGDYFNEHGDYERDDLLDRDPAEHAAPSQPLRPQASYADETVKGDLPHEVGNEGLFEKVLHPTKRSMILLNSDGTIERGMNLLEAIEADKLANTRRESENIYYPFADKEDWEVGSWMTRTCLSSEQINSFLKLQYVKGSPLSFTSANDLRSRIEALPEIPRWKHQTLELSNSNFKPLTPIVLYWRDALEVAAHMASNPVFAQALEYDPYQLYDTSGTVREHVYGEFLSANWAWDYQASLDDGHSFLGIICASDKTPLTVGTGNREMHPVLISIANIKAGVRMKASSHAFALVGYLPIPKYGQDCPAEIKAVLTARIFHFSLDIIFEKMKQAEKSGARMSDSHGNIRIIHTPLVSYIADYPEQRLIACVSGNASPLSTATQNDFGDETAHPRRTRTFTLSRIFDTCAQLDPITELAAFTATCRDRELNGVHQPFWRDWGAADPSVFLTPDALHAWHKMFFDHPLRWVMNIVGPKEFDQRLGVLQPRVGIRSWPHGVSKLKQLTGREHRELEKLVIAVAGDQLPDDVMSSIRALIDFIFQAQNIIFYKESIHALQEALREFHHYKWPIVLNHGRIGKNGRIGHFNIPKLELMQGVADSVSLLGAPYQWTSDVTERCHITHVKTPYRLSNRRNFHAQCVRYMDRIEKTRLFSLYTRLAGNGMSLLNEMVVEARMMASNYPEATWLSHVLPDEQALGNGVKRIPDYFSKERSHISADHAVAILLNTRPHATMSIDAAAAHFHLTDLQPALGDYFNNLTYSQRNGSRRSGADCTLPFTQIQIWYNFRLQRRSSQDPRICLPPQTIQALPPTPSMPFGRANTVIINDIDVGVHTSQSQDGSCSIVQIHMIFLPIMASPLTSHPLIYATRFKFSSRHTEITADGVPVYKPAPRIDMFLMERHRRANLSFMGDIFSLRDVEHPVQLVPRFDGPLHENVTCDNALESFDLFYLNNFASKENFHAILSYQ